MSQNGSLCLFDLIRDPDNTVEDLTGLPDDESAEYVKEYGIGIDCHSKFIEVCIRYRSGESIKKAQARFSTNWDDLVAAHDWCFEILGTKADPVPDLSEPLHYLVESTANYHTPVCMAWAGILPSSIPRSQVRQNARPMSSTAGFLPSMTRSMSGANATSPTKK